MGYLLSELPLHAADSPGLFVSFDGVDGAGKSTLVSELGDFFSTNGHKVVVTRSPTRRALDIPAYKQYMYEPGRREEIDYRGLLCALTGDRLQHAKDVIIPSLRAGKIVLCDRYIFSGQAHLLARGFEYEPWFLDLARHLPKPQLAVLVQADLDVCLKRVASRAGYEESYIERPFLDNLVEKYREVGRLNRLEVVDTTYNSSVVCFEHVKELVEAQEV